MDQYQLSLLQAARAHMREERHLGTFSPDRWVGFSFEGAAYRARGYTTSAGVLFDLYGAKDGRISKDPILAGCPVIPPVACVRDEYARSVVRCQSLTRGHPWVIEQGVAHQVVIAEYEILPGDQEAEERGLVYLAAPDGEFLAVEGRFLTVFQPIQAPDVRMPLAGALRELRGHLLDGMPSDSAQIVDTLLLIERSLYSGHIDLIPIDTRDVLRRAIETLEQEDLVRNVVELYQVQDRLGMSAPNRPPRFGASGG